MKITRLASRLPVVEAKKRVAAYARVSVATDKELKSLSAQISRYSEYIQANPAWDYAGVYFDKGVSGTSAKARLDFQRMMADCEAGKIDIILVKSISRFARNTVDLLNTVRHLKELGIEVRFEKENLRTLSSDGELMLSLLASFAQNEAESISKNVRWGIRKRFEQGIPNGRYRIYGYRWNGNELAIYEPEAAKVRWMFKSFLEGKTPTEMKRELVMTSDKHWTTTTIVRMLQNVFYKGDIMLQKFYVESPLTHRVVINGGEHEKYLVPAHHEAVVTPELFDRVQAEIKHLKENGTWGYRRHYANCLTARIKCGLCGRSLVRIKGRYRCMNAQCTMKGVSEDILMKEIAKAMGMDTFYEKNFRELVDHLELLPGDALRCVFCDGSVTEWTFAMEANRDFLLHGQNYPFTHRIKCGHCGVTFNRVKGRGGIVRWSHPGSGKACGVKSLSEEKLKAAAREVLGEAEFIGEEFMTLVDYIRVEHPNEVVFQMKDGEEIHKCGNFRNANPRLSDEQLSARRETLKKARAVLSAKRRKQKCQGL